jgi:uncharacterized protein
VNSVGVELNTASAPLLARVAGIGPTIAKTHRGPPQRKRRLQEPKGRCSTWPASGRKHLRASGGLPARARRRAPPRRQRGAPGALRPRRENRRRTSAFPCALSSATRRRRRSHRPREVHRRRRRQLHDERHPGRARQNPGRDPRSTFEPPKFRDDVTHDGRPQAGHGARGGRHQRHRVRRVRRRRRPPGRPGARLQARRSLHQGPERGREGRRQAQVVRVLEVDLPRKRISLLGPQGRRPPGGGFHNAVTFV